MKRLIAVFSTIFATALLWLLLEFTASFFVLIPRETTRQHPRLNHTWPPGKSYWIDTWVKDNPLYSKPYRYIFNQQAWLETYDIAKTPPPDTFRIFYLGDSFTGGCVPMEESLPSRVEAALNERAKQKGLATKFEVINTGTSSYSPVIFYILLRYYLMDFHPDLIVVNVDMTDAFDDWKYRRTLAYDDKGDPWAAVPRNIYKDLFVETTSGLKAANFLTRTMLFVERNSYVFNFLQNKLLARRAAPSGTPASALADAGTAGFDHWSWCQENWNDETKGNVDFTLAMIAKTIRFAREHGVRVVITSVPHYEQYQTDAHGKRIWSDRPHREIARVTRESGAVYFNGYKALEASISKSSQEEFYYKGDMHFNPKGNALWAQSQIQELLNPDYGLLPATMY